MEKLKMFAASLLSRKFLMAAAVIYGLVQAKQYTEAVAALVAFLGVEGAADVVVRKVQAEARKVQVEAEAYEKAREAN